jgi:hypothetical protein
MKIPRLLCALLILLGLAATQVQANWMTFFGSGVTSNGLWPAGSQLSGGAVASASSFVNGIPATPFIGLAPNSVGSLSADYVATGLQPNVGNVVDLISTPYNDTGDKYHTVIDFSGTTGGSNPGVLPAGSIFALVDLDSTENYRQITATNAANAVITTPWIGGPNGYFDMNNPLTPVAFMVPVPTLTGPALGVYQMFGPSANFDVGMWLFKTTQDVKTISFNMELGIQGGPFQGGGGAGWAFYTPPSQIVPEPSSMLLIACGLALGVIPRRRGEVIRS